MKNVSDCQKGDQLERLGNCVKVIMQRMAYPTDRKRKKQKVSQIVLLESEL